MSNDNMKTIMQVFQAHGLANVQFIAGKNQKQCVRIMYNGKSISTSAWTRKNAEEFVKTCQNCGVSDAISLNSYDNEEEGQEYAYEINTIRSTYQLINYNSIINFILSDFISCYSIKRLLRIRTGCNMEDGLIPKKAYRATIKSLKNDIKNNEIALYKGHVYSYITISYIYSAWEIDHGKDKPNKETAEKQAKKIINKINRINSLV